MKVGQIWIKKDDEYVNPFYGRYKITIIEVRGDWVKYSMSSTTWVDKIDHIKDCYELYEDEKQ